MTPGESWDRALEALADRYRRRVLVALLEHNPQRDVDVDPLDVAGEMETERTRLEIDMFHRHLPKLEELGFISWDPNTREIRRGPHWADVEPILGLIHERSDELPDGWL